MSDAGAMDLLGSSETAGGWGRHQTVRVGEADVFVKRVQVTDLEHANAFSTRNLYELPLFYQYGVGSAGFGVFRELAMHVKTTQWVLDGATANFPLMYHYRIMPRSTDDAEVDEERLTGYVKYWGGSENVGRYWRDRVHARHELVIFLEHVPFVLQQWLGQHPKHVPKVLEELRTTIDFLRAHGIIHFDAHFANIVTDGERPYLTDFGLALDRSFELTAEEIAFFEAHTHYDYGEVLWNLGYGLPALYNALTEDDKRDLRDKIGMADAGPLADTYVPLVTNVEALADDSRLNLHPDYVAAVVQYRSVMTLVQGFFVELRANLRKDTPYPQAELLRRLAEVGIAD
jgi:hypothetical protein